jgi:uncharacterized protein (TIGR03435 family)
MLAAIKSTRNSGVALSALLLLAAVLSLSAQLLRPTEPTPSFEVATIKPWSPPAVISPQKPVKIAPLGGPAPVSDRVHFIGQIELLIGAAYDLPFSSDARILGGPDWIRSESDRYEVTGKIDDAQYAAIQKMTIARQQEQVSLMEQSLLADRFRFKAHIETREMPRYALVVAKNGARLERAQDDAKTRLTLARNGQENVLSATAVSIEELARSPFLRIDNRQVVDKTGLQGRFTFTLKFSPRTSADAGGSVDVGNAPELPTALQEQLGLRLVPGNGPVEVVVIDRIERPSEN